MGDTKTAPAKVASRRKPKDGKDMTKVYHIAYAPEIKKAYLFFWGCNLKCRGCLCKKEINCLALEENLDTVFRDPYLKPPQTPEQFLKLDELIGILKKVEINEVLFEGQEATCDPLLPEICRLIKKEFRRCWVSLNTNGIKYPDLTNIDEVIFSIKAVTDSLYKDYTERSNKSALRNFKKIYDYGVKMRAESVFIPGLIDLEETEKIAMFIAGVDKDISFRIDAYFESGDNPWRHPTPEEMAQAVAVSKKHLNNVYSTQQTKKDLKKEDLIFEVVKLY